MTTKWISVKDRLPEEIEDENGRINSVLTYSVYDKEMLCSQWGVSNTACVKNHEQWGITHWMPLPDSPQVPSIAGEE